MLELIVRLLLGGAVVVGALYALRWAQARGMTARGGPELRVVGRTGLTRQALVAVVEVDGRRWLVGAADQGVQLIAELGPAPDGHGTAAPPSTTADHDGPPAADPDRAPGTRRRLHGPALHAPALGVHRTDAPTHGPRIGPLDRLRAMTVRTHLREPIRDPQPPR